MTRIGIITGFLGAGKTTLLKKLLQEAFAGQRVCVIENEFGSIGFDAVRLQETGVTLRQLTSGCICCSLVQDLHHTVVELKRTVDPDYILLEPSGASELQGIQRAIWRLGIPDVTYGFPITVVDPQVCETFIEEFGDFYRNQIAMADCVVLSRTQLCMPTEITACLRAIRQLQTRAPVITADWEHISGDNVLSVTLESSRNHQAEETYGEQTLLSYAGSDSLMAPRIPFHRKRRTAADRFDTFSMEWTTPVTQTELVGILNAINRRRDLGSLLRVKGIAPSGVASGAWLQFDMTTTGMAIFPCTDALFGGICLIGTELRTEFLADFLQDKILTRSHA